MVYYWIRFGDGRTILQTLMSTYLIHICTCNCSTRHTNSPMQKKKKNTNSPSCVSTRIHTYRLVYHLRTCGSSPQDLRTQHESTDRELIGADKKQVHTYVGTENLIKVDHRPTRPHLFAAAGDDHRTRRQSSHRRRGLRLHPPGQHYERAPRAQDPRILIDDEQLPHRQSPPIGILPRWRPH